MFATSMNAIILQYYTRIAPLSKQTTVKNQQHGMFRIGKFLDHHTSNTKEWPC